MKERLSPRAVVLPPRDHEPSLDLQRVRSLLRERARFIVLCTLGFMALAGVYLLIKRNVYASTATLAIEQQDHKVVNTMLDSQESMQDDLHTLDVMKTVEQSLTSDALELRVIQLNHLATNPDFLKPRADEPYTDDELLLAFSKAVTVKLRRGTRLIDVTAESTNPLLAKQIAQSLVDEYQRSSAERAAGSSKSNEGFLADEATRLREKLERSEKSLQTYREEHNALSLEDKQNIVVETLKDLNLKLNAARTDRMKLEADFAQYQTFADQDPKRLLSLASVAGSPIVQDAQKRLADQQAQFAVLTRRYRSEHPKYIQAQSQIAQTQGDLDRAIVRSAETIPSAYHAAQANEQKLEQALHEQEQASFELNKIAVPYQALLREVESNRALYQPVFNRLSQSSVAQALAASPVRVAENARLTTEPVRPKKVLILLASLVVGLGAGIGWCLLRDAADLSIKTVDDAESALGLPVISAVPQLGRKRSARGASPVVMVSEPASLTAEAFRSLRTTLALNARAGQQSVLFTSAQPSEGKTFCSINCAVALAQQGYRTLLVDADLRCPSIAGVFGTDTKAPGLTEYLRGQVPLSAAIHGAEFENLSLLPAGGTARNPAELLSHAKMDTFFKEEALAGYDWVIFDTAPVNAVSDALAFVGHASRVCLVVRAGQTPAKAVQRAHRALAAVGASDVGLALNHLPLHGGSGCFYHYISSYGAEGVYGADKAVRA